MDNFIFENPTKLCFGVDAEMMAGEQCAAYGKRVLIHYGGDYVKQSGLFNRITDSLSAHGLEYIELDGVVPNPRVSLVRKGIALCRAENIDIILAIGGGSAMDSAKAIAMGVYYEGDVWELFAGAETQKGLPVGVVVTIPASGSESGATSVLSNEETLEKSMFTHPEARPKFALMNPALTKTLPPFQRACGICDMLSHVMERYFTNTPDVQLTDRLCEATMQTIVESGLAAMQDPGNDGALSQLMLAGNVAHNDSLGVGREQDWASHMIEHELSARLDIAHGAGLSIILPAWMRYVWKHDAARFARFARKVWEAEEKDDEAAAQKGIAATEQFFEKLGLPVRLSQISVQLEEDTLRDMAAAVTKYFNPGSFVVLSTEDVFEILRAM